MNTVRRRRDRITPALVVVTVVLAIGVAVIVYLAETKDEHSDPPGGGVAVPHGAQAPPGALSSAGAADSAFQCWDGVDAATLTQCTDPTGSAGLGWVFPEEADARRYGGCHDKSAALRSAFVQCDLSWHGHVVHLHLSAWTDWLRARDHYDGGGAVRERSRRADGSTLIQWQPRQAAVPFNQARWKVAEMLSGRPWTLAAYSDERTVAQAALAAFGEIRDVREWRGVER